MSSKIKQQHPDDKDVYIPDYTDDDNLYFTEVDGKLLTVPKEKRLTKAEREHLRYIDKTTPTKGTLKKMALTGRPDGTYIYSENVEGLAPEPIAITNEEYRLLRRHIILKDNSLTPYGKKKIVRIKATGKVYETEYRWKYCKYCEQLRPIRFFYKRRDRQWDTVKYYNRRKNICIFCKQKRNKEYYQRNKEKWANINENQYTKIVPRKDQPTPKADIKRMERRLEMRKVARLKKKESK
jgi:hypothetical protein